LHHENLSRARHAGRDFYCKLLGHDTSSLLKTPRNGHEWEGQEFQPLSASPRQRCSFRLHGHRSHVSVLNDYLERLAALPAQPVLLRWTFGSRRKRRQNAFHSKDAPFAGMTERNSAGGIHAIGNHRTFSTSLAQRSWIAELPHRMANSTIVSCYAAVTSFPAPRGAQSQPQAMSSGPLPPPRGCTGGSCCVPIRRQNLRE